MGSFSIWHWLIVLVVVLLLFGRGKIPELMGDVAKGIKNFKRGMTDDETAEKDLARAIEHQVQEPIATADPRVDAPLSERETVIRKVG